MKSTRRFLFFGTSLDSSLLIFGACCSMSFPAQSSFISGCGRGPNRTKAGKGVWWDSITPIKRWFGFKLPARRSRSQWLLCYTSFYSLLRKAIESSVNRRGELHEFKKLQGKKKTRNLWWQFGVLRIFSIIAPIFNLLSTDFHLLWLKKYQNMEPLLLSLFLSTASLYRWRSLTKMTFHVLGHENRITIWCEIHHNLTGK